MVRAMLLASAPAALGADAPENPLNPMALLGLALFFVLLFWAAHLLRKWAAKRGGVPGMMFAQSKYLKVLDTMGLPGGGMLMMVQAGQRVLLISTADKKASLVAELSAEELTAFAHSVAPAADSAILQGWAARLGGKLRPKNVKPGKKPQQQDGFGPLLSRLSEQPEDANDALAQMQQRLEQRLSRRQDNAAPGEETHIE